jgi:hypothetical protein
MPGPAWLLSPGDGLQDYQIVVTAYCVIWLSAVRMGNCAVFEAVQYVIWKRRIKVRRNPDFAATAARYPSPRRLCNGHKPCNGFARACNDHFFAQADTHKQARKLGLGLVDVHGHRHAVAFRAWGVFQIFGWCSVPAAASVHGCTPGVSNPRLPQVKCPEGTRAWGANAFSAFGCGSAGGLEPPAEAADGGGRHAAHPHVMLSATSTCIQEDATHLRRQGACRVFGS